MQIWGPEFKSLTPTIIQAQLPVPVTLEMGSGKQADPGAYQAKWWASGSVIWMRIDEIEAEQLTPWVKALLYKQKNFSLNPEPIF